VKVGDLVYYNGHKHYTLDRIGRVGIVICANRTKQRLKRRKVVFSGGYVCNMNICDMELISESR